MERRDFVKKLAVTGGVGLAATGLLAGCGGESESGGAANVVTSPSVTWRLVSSFSRSLDTIYGAAEVLAERVKALTNGKFNIRVFPGGEFVPALEVLGAVQNGTAQMGHSASYYYTGKNPALAFDTCVPFGLKARQFNAWMYDGDGMELTRGLFADFNVINFPGGNTGTQMGGWFRRRVDTVADLRGIKMRIPGLGGDVMSRLGVSVQLISGGEIYPALERGAIDATEWVGPYDDEKLGLNQIAENYYYPGWWEPGAGLSFYVNKDAWEKLPSTYQAALEAAAAEANVRMLAGYDAKNPAAFKRIVDGGTAVRPFGQDIMAAAEREAMAIMNDYAAADASYRRVFENQMAFRDLSNRWLATAELTFAEYAIQKNA
ncbi:MAG: TRAP transporter substrate-binding protein [Bacteroidetes bacterium]|nr:TRAP transporter substrate-binding protein [Bacteroidota bacterium]